MSTNKREGKAMEDKNAEEKFIAKRKREMEMQFKEKIETKKKRRVELEKRQCERLREREAQINMKRIQFQERKNKLAKKEKLLLREMYIEKSGRMAKYSSMLGPKKVVTSSVDFPSESEETKYNR